MSGMRMLVMGAMLSVSLTAVPQPAAAHCDSMDGPVVKAAREALASGRVDLALVWVLPADEAEIRAAFDRALAVRQLEETARELADLWFFETLVRVHRAGEGEPYTGLKPGGGEPEGGIAEADAALANRSVDALAGASAAHLERALRERFGRVQSLRAYEAADLAAGRRYVHAYVDYIHFVEALHHLLHETESHGEPGGHTATR